MCVCVCGKKSERPKTQTTDPQNQSMKKWENEKGDGAQDKNVEDRYLMVMRGKEENYPTLLYPTDFVHFRDGLSK